MDILSGETAIDCCQDPVSAFEGVSRRLWLSGVKSNLYALSSSVFTVWQNLLFPHKKLEVTLICLVYLLGLFLLALLVLSVHHFRSLVLPGCLALHACLPVGSGSRELCDTMQTATYLLMYWHQKEPGWPVKGHGWFQSLFHSTVPGGTESTTSKEEHLGTNGMKENAYAACEIVKASLTYRCEVVMICNDMP